MGTIGEDRQECYDNTNAYANKHSRWLRKNGPAIAGRLRDARGGVGDGSCGASEELSAKQLVCVHCSGWHMWNSETETNDLCPISRPLPPQQPHLIFNEHTVIC